MPNTKGTGVIGAGSAAWLKVIANPLKRRKREESDNSNGRAPLSDDSINAIIEGEIIPRLLMAHSAGKTSPAPIRDSEIDPSDATRFASLPLRLEAANLLEEVDNFLAEGVSAEAIYLDLLAPAARKLGEMWENDECDFVDVTMGLWRLQEVMREIAARAPTPPIEDKANPRASLFAPMPGEQHYFASLMLDEVFANAGWRSEAIVRPERSELLDILSRKPFDVVGLTLSRDCPSSAISSIIKAMRSVSANPHISVLVGGHFINQNPALVAEVGADGTGADARAALELAERLVTSAPVRAQSMR